ncbi:hypothetical protein HHUSO_G31566 [Huso huso]|uniref:Uncharacterized protein n=1 Tax=Huso huso TaxID=61971 RepID=A0ABR0YBU9_HUSHU
MSVNGTEIQFTKEALSKDARLELLMVWSQMFGIGALCFLSLISLVLYKVRGCHIRQDCKWNLYPVEQENYEMELEAELVKSMLAFKKDQIKDIVMQFKDDLKTETNPSFDQCYEMMKTTGPVVARSPVQIPPQPLTHCVTLSKSLTSFAFHIVTLQLLTTLVSVSRLG